jgi:hypothetical protein
MGRLVSVGIDAGARPYPGHLPSMEAKGAFPLRFVRLPRFVQLKRGDKLLQLILGQPPQISLRQIGTATLKG